MVGGRHGGIGGVAGGDGHGDGGDSDGVVVMGVLGVVVMGGISAESSESRLQFPASLGMS